MKLFYSLATILCLQASFLSAFQHTYIPQGEDRTQDILAALYSTQDDIQDLRFSQQERKNKEADKAYYETQITFLEGKVAAYKWCLNVLAYPNDPEYVD